jgi:hypothetical protein
MTLNGPKMRESMCTQSLNIINHVQPQALAKPNTKQSIAHPTDPKVSKYLDLHHIKVYFQH